MDCRFINARLNNIIRDAKAAKRLLSGGDTGKNFANVLCDIEAEVVIVRAETDTPKIGRQFGPFDNA